MLRPGHVIALCVLSLLTVGVVMVNSAGMSVPAVESGAAGPRPPETAVWSMFLELVFSRSSIYMGLALVAMWVASRLPVNRLAATAEELGGGGGRGYGRGAGLTMTELKVLVAGTACLSGILLTVYLPGIGHEVNGSHRWLRLPIGGDLSVQPSEIAKWGLIVLVAWYGATRAAAGAMGSFVFGLGPGLAAVGAVSLLVIVEDLGTGALIGAVGCLMLLAAGAKVWQFAMFVPLGIGLIVGAIIKSPYRVERIMAFVDPFKDAQDTGYHMIQSMAAVAGGEFFGRGLGHGLQKFGYLPEDKTDFLFAVICEELGVPGAAIVVLLLAGLIWAGWMIVRREPRVMLKLVGLGVVATVGLQALINLAVVTGLGPTKGIALPLVSSGGTGWILTAASLGLLMAMDREQSVREGESADEPMAGLVEARGA